MGSLFENNPNVEVILDMENYIDGTATVSDSIDSGCPSLDDPTATATEALTTSAQSHHYHFLSGSNSNDYDTDYFGGSHDNDELFDEESFDDPLSWRLDPSMSLSDWEIQIKSTDGFTTKTTRTYFVHKTVLAVGPKASAYFTSLFRCSRSQRENNVVTTAVAEATTSTSIIELEESAANAFPQLLDFMYSPSHILQINTKNAVALRHLAQYFGIRMLHRKVMEFLRQDIKNLENVDSYIQDSINFHDEKVSNFVANTCSTNILQLQPNSNLIKTVNPTFFLHVISSIPEIDNPCTAVSAHLSSLVASYCQIHLQEIDETMFRKLTNKTHMPLIDHDVALTLLHIESILCCDLLSSKSLARDFGDDVYDDNIDIDKLSCLQKRCIRVLALNWKQLINSNSQKANGQESQEKAYSILKGLNSKVLIELFDKSLSIASQRLEEATKVAEVERVNLEQKYDIQLNLEQENYRRQQEFLAKVQRENNQTIKSLRNQLANCKSQLAAYSREMKCFHRVPTTHSFNDIKNSTYHHLSQSEPFDHLPQGHVKFGRRKPTSVPKFVNDRSEDGYLFLPTMMTTTTTSQGSIPVAASASSGSNIIEGERYPVYYYCEPPTPTKEKTKKTPSLASSAAADKPRHIVLRRIIQQSRRNYSSSSASTSSSTSS